MFSMVQEMIISEYWTVNYCSYLVERFEEIYPREIDLIGHLKNNLKILTDKNGAEENEINSLLFGIE